MDNSEILYGELSPIGKVTGRLSAPSSLYGYLSTNIHGDSYEGEYTVDPMFHEQTLETSGKTLLQNVIVNAIYLGETANPQGGNTVYIGGEFIG